MADKAQEKMVKVRVVLGSITHGHEEAFDAKGNPTGRFTTRRTLEGEICELEESEARRMGAYLSPMDLVGEDGKFNGRHKCVDLVR